MKQAVGARLVAVAIATALVSGCMGNLPQLPRPGGEAGQGRSQPVQIVDRDVEAPEVFEAAEPGLWDGRPSLGGVWVAHPDVEDPERVIIRNEANGKFVIGALFRRERDNPGPRLQVSSDAASALELLAGQPTPLSVTALRREEAPEVTAPEAVAAPTTTAPRVAEGAPAADGAISARPIDAAAAPATAAAPAAASGSGPDRPYVQVGIFSVEANANRAAGMIRDAGHSAEVKRETSRGSTIWRVLAGPVATTSARTDLIAAMRRIGFADAYAVRR